MTDEKEIETPRNQKSKYSFKSTEELLIAVHVAKNAEKILSCLKFTGYVLLLILLGVVPLITKCTVRIKQTWSSLKVARTTNSVVLTETPVHDAAEENQTIDQELTTLHLGNKRAFQEISDCCYSVIILSSAVKMNCKVYPDTT